MLYIKNKMAFTTISALLFFLYNCSSILFYSFMFHELGHWLYFYKRLKKNPEIRLILLPPNEWRVMVGHPGHYKGLNSKQRQNLYYSGVILGGLPILFSLYFNLLFCLIIIPYLLHFCKADIKNIKLIQKQKKHNRKRIMGESQKQNI